MPNPLKLSEEADKNWVSFWADRDKNAANEKTEEPAEEKKTGETTQ